MSDTGAVERVARALYESYGLFIDQDAEGWESDAREVLAAAAPTEEVAEVIREHHRDGRKSWGGTTWCTCGLRNIGDWHNRHVAEQVAALWGAR